MATVEPPVTVGQTVAPPPSRGSQISMGVLSMVFFIGSEVMLFGSLFTAYFFTRFNIADQWPPLNAEGQPFELPKVITAVNTAILVSSSFTMGADITLVSMMPSSIRAVLKAPSPPAPGETRPGVGA